MISVQDKDMLLRRFLGDFCDGVETFGKEIAAMTETKSDTLESAREELELWAGNATRSHLTRRNVEKARREIENGNKVRVPENARGDVDVESERAFTAKADRLDNSPPEFDEFEPLAIGVQVGEELPSDGNEREGWTNRNEVIEEVHSFEDDTGCPCLFGKVLLDNAKAERSGIPESECNLRFPAWNLDAEVIDFDFAPCNSSAYIVSEMTQKLGNDRRKRRYPFQLSTRAGLARRS